MRAPHAPHRVRKLIIGEPRTVPRDEVRRHDEFERVQPRAHDGAELCMLQYAAIDLQRLTRGLVERVHSRGVAYRRTEEGLDARGRRFRLACLVSVRDEVNDLRECLEVLPPRRAPVEVELEPFRATELPPQTAHDVSVRAVDRRETVYRGISTQICRGGAG